MKFALDPRLESDTVWIGDLSLSSALLNKDARYPWLILAPRRTGVVEIADLTIADRATLIEEIAHASQCVRGLHGVAKVNVGALGNIVAQLHIHIVGRNAHDFAWPGPVWGAGAPRNYEAREREALIARLRKDLDLKTTPGTP